MEQLNIRIIKFIFCILFLVPRELNVIAKAVNIPHKRPLILIPGFACTRLQVWSQVECPGPFSFDIRSDIWVSITKIVGATNCQMECMQLNPLTQEDSEMCRVRPDEGIDAIAELEPGIITGSLSTIQKQFADETSKRFGYTPNDLIAVPYDFRLAPLVLEERDNFFSRLKNTIEFSHECQKHKNGKDYIGGVVILAHSLGNNIFRYFLEWLRTQFYSSSDYQDQLDEYISIYFAVGAPLLGAPESLRAWASGMNMGLPISEDQSRKMTVTFSSIFQMFPFISSDVDYSAKKQKPPKYIFNVTLSESGKVFRFTPESIVNGTMFQQLSKYDKQFRIAYHQLEKFYKNDSIIDIFSPQKRPPIRKVIVIYGVGLPTVEGYNYVETVSTNKNKDNNVLSKNLKTQNIDDSADFRQKIDSISYTDNGDGTVPYWSLSHCHEWLDEKVNRITIPLRTVYNEDEVEVLYGMNKLNSSQFEYIKRSHPTKNLNLEPKTVIYENTNFMFRVDMNGVVYPIQRSTAIYEMDGVDHRRIIGSNEMIFEILTEIAHVIEHSNRKNPFHIQTMHKFADRLNRIPTTDYDCFQDYYAIRCAFPEYCEYNYRFGDVHLSQSCRLKLRKSAKPHSEDILINGDYVQENEIEQIRGDLNVAEEKSDLILDTNKKYVNRFFSKKPKQSLNHKNYLKCSIPSIFKSSVEDAYINMSIFNFSNT